MLLLLQVIQLSLQFGEEVSLLAVSWLEIKLLLLPDRVGPVALREGEVGLMLP